MTARNWLFTAGLIVFVIGLSIGSPLVIAIGIGLLFFAWTVR